MKKPPSNRLALSDSRQKRVVFTADAGLKIRHRFIAAPAATANGTEAAAPPKKIATLSGYALRWGVLSSDRGGYKVRLLPGSAAFATPCLALYHHDFARLLGNSAIGTLRIFPDDVGVRVEIDLPDTTDGRDVEELVERGDLRGMSFAMVDAPTSTITTEAGEQIVNASSYLVDEVTVTAIPAFIETSIEVAEGEEDEGDTEKMAKKSARRKEFARESSNLERLRLSTLTL